MQYSFDMQTQIKAAKQIAVSTKSTVAVRRDGITIGVVLPNGQFHHVAV